MRVIPIASGKGGVGKSLIAANLSVAFAQSGMRVVLADLDLGASNLHLIIGHRKPGGSLGAFLQDEKRNFKDCVSQTDINGLRFIPGDAEIPDTATLKPQDRKRILKNLFSLESDTDILVLDLGAGTHQSILEFFLCSGNGIVVSAPTVTSILNAYVFLKNAVFRLMYNSFKKNSAAYNFIENARKSGSEGEGMGMKVLYIPKMLEEIKKIDTESYEIFTDNMNKFHPKLIMNMLDDPSDGDVAMKIKRSCEAYLGLKIEHLGVIYRDSIQDIALASRLPVTIYKPGSLISEAIFRIADKILSSPENDVFIGTNDDVDASFEDAATTAESDFENKLQYVEELLHSGALSEGDLIETVKTQSMEITKLKKENSFLKLKLTRAAEKGFKV